MKKLLLLSLIALASLGLGFFSNKALAIDDASKQIVCESIGAASGTNGCVQQANDITVDGLIRKVIDILSWVVGAASVIMIIIGGVRYTTSGGESAGVSSAKNTIIFALVGVVVVVFAQVIAKFTLDRVTPGSLPLTILRGFVF